MSSLGPTVPDVTEPRKRSSAVPGGLDETCRRRSCVLLAAVDPGAIIAIIFGLISFIGWIINQVNSASEDSSAARKRAARTTGASWTRSTSSLLGARKVPRPSSVAETPIPEEPPEPRPQPPRKAPAPGQRKPALQGQERRRGRPQPRTAPGHRAVRCHHGGALPVSGRGPTLGTQVTQHLAEAMAPRIGRAVRRRSPARRPAVGRQAPGENPHPVWPRGEPRSGRRHRRRRSSPCSRSPSGPGRDHPERGPQSAAVATSETPPLNAGLGGCSRSRSRTLEVRARSWSTCPFSHSRAGIRVARNSLRATFSSPRRISLRLLRPARVRSAAPSMSLTVEDLSNSIARLKLLSDAELLRAGPSPHRKLPRNSTRLPHPPPDADRLPGGPA